MEKTALQEGELILAQATGLHHAGVVASPGQLVLTDQRLLFRPKTMYRLVGAKPVAIFTDAIERAEVEGINRILKVTGDGVEHRFSGPQIRVIRDRLASMLHNPTASGADFQAMERVLIACDARRPVGKVMATEGQLVVSTEQVRFRPGGVGGMVWGKAKFRCRIRDIEKLTLKGRRRQLEIKTASERYTVMSGSVGEIHGTIRAVQDALTAGRSLVSLKVDYLSVLVHRGPIATRGTAVFTDRRFSFVPAGLDRIAGGAERIEIFYRRLLGVEMPPEASKRLVLGVEEGRVELSVPDRERVFDDLVSRMGAQPGVAELAMVGGYDDPEEIQEKITGLWTGRLPPGVGEADIFDPTIYVNERGVAQPGWLLVHGKYAHWLPAESPEHGAAAVTLPLSQINRAKIHDPDSPRIDAEIQGQNFQFYPRAGATIRRQFWKTADEHRVRREKKVDESGIDALNRRETYRVKTFAASPPTILGQLHIEGEDEPRLLEAKLVDFSMGGCAVVVEERLGEYESLYFQVRGEDEARLIKAEVVYQRRHGQPEGFRLGIRFSPKDQGEIKHLRSSWMEMQRKMAAQRVV